MTEIECGGGFKAVPYESVTLNGHYLRKLNTRPEQVAGDMALVSPNGKVLMGEDGRRPFLYRDLDDCRRDAAVCGRYPEFTDQTRY